MGWTAGTQPADAVGFIRPDLELNMSGASVKLDAESLRRHIECDPTFGELVVDGPVESDHEWRLALLSWFKGEPIYRVGYAFDISDTTRLRAARFAEGRDLVGYAFLLQPFDGADEIVIGWTRTRRSAEAATTFVNRSFERLRALRDARRDGNPAPMLSAAARELQGRIDSGVRDAEGDPLAGFVPRALPLFERDEIGVVLAGEVAKWQTWAPGWLVETGSLRGGAALRAVLDRPLGPASMKIRAAWALAELHQDDEGFRALVSPPFLRSTWWEDRNLIANLLARVPQPEADDALLELVGDVSELVRYVAFDSLCTRWHMPSAGDGSQTRLRVLHIRHQSRFPAIRDPAVHEIRTLFQSLREGSSPDELGLKQRGGSAAATRVEQSMVLPHGERGAWRDSWDLAALRTLNAGLDRDWAVAASLSLLERGDPRAADGLVALRAVDSLPTLRALRAECEATLRPLVERAIAGLET